MGSLEPVSRDPAIEDISVSRTLQCAVAASVALLAGLALVAATPSVPATRTAVAPSHKPTTSEIQHARESALADAFFGNTKLSRITIDVEPKALKGLNDAPKAWVHATIKIIVPGQREVTYKDVAMHLKGGPGSFRKVEDKPAMTLNFDKFLKPQTFQGIDKLLLNNSVQDPSFTNENLCGAILRACGGYAARASNAQVILNGRDLGPYVVKEGFKSAFFRRFFPDDDGNLYEGAFNDVDANLPIHYGKKRKPPEDQSDAGAKKKYEEKLKADEAKARAKLKELVDACREADPGERRRKLDKVLDVDAFLTFMAFESMTAHWDGYCANRNNYRIYHNRTTDKLVFIAHGMDQMFQRPEHPLADANQALVCKAVLATLRDRQRYYERVAELRNKWLTPEKLLGEVDRLATRISPLMQELGPQVLEQYKQQTAELKERIRQRLANIDKQLAQAPKALKFDTAGVASLADQKWEAVKENPTPATTDAVYEERKPKLRIKFDGQGGGGAASWRATLALPPGRYVFEGQMRTASVIPPDGATVHGPNDANASAGAGLLVVGGAAVPRQVGFSRYTLVRREFDVTSAEADTTVSCELTAKSGEALFDLSTLRIRKKK
jgi:hypothetical protein